MAISSINQGILQTSPYSGSTSDDVLSSLGRWLGFETNYDLNREFNAKEIAQNNQLLRDLYFQEVANAFNAQEAQKQRDFEGHLSSTAFQRATEDLKKAGLNPILAYGSPSSTPSGASASSNGGRSSANNRSNLGVGNGLSTIVSLIAGIYTKGAEQALKSAMFDRVMDMKKENASDKFFLALERDRNHFERDQAWRSWYDSKGSSWYNFKKR